MERNTKRKLISEGSPLYRRRMVRELNRCYEGFHASFGDRVVRCNGARLSNGVLQVRATGDSPEWISATGARFFAPSVVEVVASREP